MHTSKPQNLPVSIPCDDISIKSWRHQQASVCIILYVLDPAGVAMQWAHLRVEFTQIPQCNGGVVRAGRKQPVVEKPE